MALPFLARFHANVSAHPDRDALVIGSSRLSYAALSRRVRAIREHVQSTVDASERFIGIWATHDTDTYAAILAILATGRAYVPLNPSAPDARNLACLTQAGVCTVLTANASHDAETLATRLAPTRVMATDHVVDGELLDAVPTYDGDAIAYLLFTSGSTGVPKGVPIYHRNLQHFLDTVLTYPEWAFTAEDRFLQMFDLTFDLSVVSFAAPLSIGASVHVAAGSGMGFQRVARVLQREEVTVALMVPSVLTFLERYFDEIRLPALRISQFCGEALPTRLARGWQACIPNARLFNVYGPTEATIYCTSFELPAEERAEVSHNGVVSIGVALPGTTLRIVDEHLAPVADGDTGELVIVGSQVTDQYWNNPEKTATAFARLPDGATGYRTGDLAFVRAGQIHYAGRLDFQLKVDGYRVEAGEIEHHARGIDGVRDAVLLGIPNDRGTTVLHLFVLTDQPDGSGLAAVCRQQLSARVPPYMVPAKVHLRSAFPLNSNGKVDRKVLAASLAS